MSFHFPKAAGFASALTLLAGVASAATLAPGGTIPMPGTTAAANPELAGVVIQDSVVSTPNVAVPALPVNFARFEVQNRVVESAVDAAMVFAPRILFGSNVTAGNLLVDRVEMTGWGSFGIDAFYRTDGLGDRGPTFGSRSADGDQLTFDFGFPLVISNLFAGPQEESHFFALKTDATAYENRGRVSIFARAAGDNFNTYRFDVGGIAVPALAPVPLPAPLLFLISGFAALAGLRLHRSRSA